MKTGPRRPGQGSRGAAMDVDHSVGDDVSTSMVWTRSDALSSRRAGELALLKLTMGSIRVLSDRKIGEWPPTFYGALPTVLDGRDGLEVEGAAVGLVSVGRGARWLSRFLGPGGRARVWWFNAVLCRKRVQRRIGRPSPARITEVDVVLRRPRRWRLARGVVRLDRPPGRRRPIPPLAAASMAACWMAQADGLVVLPLCTAPHRLAVEFLDDAERSLIMQSVHVSSR